ncbi:MAG: MoxR family ATPase [Pseudomonadota bacterium]
MTKRPKKTGQAGSELANTQAEPDLGGRFIANDEICAFRERALEYAQAGVPVHLSGPAGMGKTAMAFDIARILGRGIAIMTGNPWLTGADFVGGTVGSTSTAVVDRYVHSVQRTEKQVRTDWGTSVLAQAMTLGQTLIYDEFTRATPEANSTLLSVLEEGLLVCTDPSGPQRIIQAHKDFRVVLTSNPHDYVAVNSAPDALLDRVVTLPMEAYSAETVAQIVTHRTGLDAQAAQRLAQMMSALYKSGDGQTFSVVRTSLLVGRVAAFRAKTRQPSDAALAEIATEILRGRGVDISLPKINTAMKHIAAE